MSSKDMAKALRHAAAYFESTGEEIDNMHAYAQCFGAEPGTDVFRFVLLDALRYRGITLDQLRFETREDSNGKSPHY